MPDETDEDELLWERLRSQALDETGEQLAAAGQVDATTNPGIASSDQPSPGSWVDREEVVTGGEYAEEPAQAASSHATTALPTHDQQEDEEDDAVWERLRQTSSYSSESDADLVDALSGGQYPVQNASGEGSGEQTYPAPSPPYDQAEAAWQEQLADSADASTYPAPETGLGDDPYEPSAALAETRETRWSGGTYDAHQRYYQPPEELPPTQTGHHDEDAGDEDEEDAWQQRAAQARQELLDHQAQVAEHSWHQTASDATPGDRSWGAPEHHEDRWQRHGEPTQPEQQEDPWLTAYSAQQAAQAWEHEDTPQRAYSAEHAAQAWQQPYQATEEAWPRPHESAPAPQTGTPGQNVGWHQQHQAGVPGYGASGWQQAEHARTTQTAPYSALAAAYEFGPPHAAETLGPAYPSQHAPAASPHAAPWDPGAVPPAAVPPAHSLAPSDYEDFGAAPRKSSRWGYVALGVVAAAAAAGVVVAFTDASPNAPAVPAAAPIGVSAAAGAAPAPASVGTEESRARDAILSGAALTAPPQELPSELQAAPKPEPAAAEAPVVKKRPAKRGPAARKAAARRKLKARRAARRRAAAKSRPAERRGPGGRKNQDPLFGL